jgi:hypothetical protein
MRVIGSQFMSTSVRGLAGAFGIVVVVVLMTYCSFFCM